LTEEIPRADPGRRERGGWERNRRQVLDRPAAVSRSSRRTVGGVWFPIASNAGSGGTSGSIASPATRGDRGTREPRERHGGAARAADAGASLRSPDGARTV